MKYWKCKANHSYLSENKTSPGKLFREIFHTFFYSNKLWKTEIEMDLEPKLEPAVESPSRLAGTEQKKNGSTTLPVRNTASECAK